MIQTYSILKNIFTCCDACRKVTGGFQFSSCHPRVFKCGASGAPRVPERNQAENEIAITVHEFHLIQPVSPIMAAFVVGSTYFPRKPLYDFFGVFTAIPTTPATGRRAPSQINLPRSHHFSLLAEDLRGPLRTGPQYDVQLEPCN